MTHHIVIFPKDLKKGDVKENLKISYKGLEDTRDGCLILQKRYT